EGVQAREGASQALRGVALPQQAEEPRAIRSVRCRHLTASLRLFRAARPRYTSVDVISYLKWSGSRLSRRPWSVSACGYIRKPTGGDVDPGRATSCAKL